MPRQRFFAPPVQIDRRIEMVFRLLNPAYHLLTLA
jgi:hypothetical protein